VSKYAARTKQGHLKTDFQGIPLVIDRPKGFVQKGVDASGTPWERTYQTDYGFIPRSRGGDGDGLDVFVGPDPTSQKAFWVTQHRDDGSFDEYKLFLGYSSAHDAYKAFRAHIPPRFFGQMRETSVQMIKALRCREPAEPSRLSRLVASMRVCDLNIADVNQNAANIHFQKGPPTAIPEDYVMAKLTTKQRNALPASAFADPANRAYPIHDKAHADDALARLEGQRGSMDADKYAAIKKRIRAAQRRFGEKPKAASNGIRVNARIGPGGHLHVTHHLSNVSFTARAYVPIAADAVAGEEGKPVWIQLAKSGHFKGHQAGEFDLNPAIFSQIIRNFREVNLGKVPFDFEHASVMPPNSGSTPLTGVPAQGWIRDLRINGSNLEALVEWKEPARSYIKDERYTAVSPVIKFGFKDPVTGENRGARLVSAALTNDPFLTGMAPLAASAGQADAEAVIDAREVPAAEAALSARGLAHAPGEYMPRIKSALCMSELQSPAECSAELSRLRAMHDADVEGDADGMHQGVSLDKYRMPLRDLVGAAPGATWEQVFDIVQDLIDAAIDEHVLEDHPGAAMDEDLAGGSGGEDLSMSQPQPPGHGPVNNEEPMAGENDTTKALSAAQAELEATKKKLDEQAAAAAAAEAKAKELELKLTAAEAQTRQIGDQVAALAKAQAERDAKDLEKKVDCAIRDYPEKGLTVAMKAHLLDVAKNNAGFFDGMYPPKNPATAHLTVDLTGNRPTGPGSVPSGSEGSGAAGAMVVMSVADLADEIAAQKNVPLEVAQSIAMNLASKSTVKRPAA